MIALNDFDALTESKPTQTLNSIHPNLTQSNTTQPSPSPDNHLIQAQLILTQANSAQPSQPNLAQPNAIQYDPSQLCKTLPNPAHPT